MKLILSDRLEMISPPVTLVLKIHDTFSLENPAWLENKRMKRWQGRTPYMLTFYKKQRDGLSLPRGTLGLIIYFCKEMGIPYQLDDRRRTLPSVEFSFRGSLKGYQQRAVREVLARDFGVLQSPTGSGKTVMALAIIATRRQPTLIIVHNKELLHQWLERIEAFLSIPREEIGIIGAGAKRIGERITVGIINSVYPMADQLREHIGHLVVDECHKCPSRTFTEAVTAFEGRYMLGLSATPYRRDGLTKLIVWYLGRKVEIDPTDLSGEDIIQNVEVFFRETAFITDFDPSEEYTQMLSQLTEDRERNSLIVADILSEASQNDGTLLVLTDRKSHCDTLACLLKANGITPDILTGDVQSDVRKAVVERLNSGGVRVLIATGQLIGEGFDCRGLSTLFLTTPIKFDGRLIQYLGRILRPSPGKDRARVFDYADSRVGVLLSSAKARERVYERKNGGGKEL